MLCILYTANNNFFSLGAAQTSLGIRDPVLVATSRGMMEALHDLYNTICIVT